jgi:hypothetical protein
MVAVEVELVGVEQSHLIAKVKTGDLVVVMV